MENRSTSSGRVQLVGQASDPLPVGALPVAWRQAEAVLLAPVAGELSAGWAEALPRRALVALAWQGLFRRLVPGRALQRLPLRPGPLIARADVALVSANDLLADASALAAVLSRPGQQLVVSHGDRGALHCERTARGLRWRRVPPIAARETLDSTGAGDVFLAAWFVAMLASRAAGQPADETAPLAVAAAAASLSVTGSGLAGLADVRQVCRELANGPRAIRRSPG
jgi:sugar/nucleoside kinase (ribokinase family)